jgi:nitrous oxide reductase accessory protein NosL
MCDRHRRDFLGRIGIGGLSLTPLAALLAGCNKGNWPEGMAEIKWDRDTCVRCSMVISDRRFAGEIRGGPDNTVFKFDDPGCMAFWLKEKAEKHPWLNDAATRIWIADFDSKSREEMRWLDPKRAYFVTRTSPMGYNFAAVSMPAPGSLDFTDMRQHVLAKGK